MTLLARTGAMAGDLLDRLMPPACASCGAIVPPGPPLCGLCEGLLPDVPRPRCRRCGAPAGTETRARPEAALADVCALCDPWPGALRHAASAVLHRPPADGLVAGLKYRGWTALAPVLGARMVEPARRVVAAAGDGEPLLAAVPLARARARRRGYNQAALLADAVARSTGWPRFDRGLLRRPAGRRQAELGREEREANVQGAFVWRAAVPPPSRPVLLVDDVLTTGATAAACAATIARAGASCIGVVTFARSIPRPDEG